MENSMIDLLGDIEFLWWLKRILFFRGDFVRLLEEFKVPKDEAVIVTFSDAFRNSDIVEFVWMNRDEAWLPLLLAKEHQSFKDIKAKRLGDLRDSASNT